MDCWLSKRKATNLSHWIVWCLLSHPWNAVFFPADKVTKSPGGGWSWEGGLIRMAEWIKYSNNWDTQDCSIFITAAARPACCMLQSYRDRACSAGLAHWDIIYEPHKLLWGHWEGLVSSEPVCSSGSVEERLMLLLKRCKWEKLVVSVSIGITGLTSPKYDPPTSL